MAKQLPVAPIASLLMDTIAKKTHWSWNRFHAKFQTSFDKQKMIVVLANMIKFKVLNILAPHFKMVSFQYPVPDYNPHPALTSMRKQPNIDFLIGAAGLAAKFNYTWRLETWLEFTNSSL